MIQFLRFDYEKIKKTEFNIISGSELNKFFIKRIGFIFLLFYSTIFLAVAIPFVWTYFIGGVLAGWTLIRFINHSLKYKKYKNGRIAVGPDCIEIFFQNSSVKILSEKITYLEMNVFGNIIIREKYNKTSFPIVFLGDDDSTNFLSMFKDMSPKRTEIIRKVVDFFDAILIAFILAMHIRQFIVQAYYIPTGSMEDTLLVGDHLLVEKITYGPIVPKMIGMEDKVHLNFLGIRVVKRGDIVIFRPPNEDKKDFIKRCIAVEGDEFHIKYGSVHVNGEKIEESYIKGVTSYRGFNAKRLEGVVPKGMVVVLGDNRDNSYDSRGFGYLPIKRIKGKAFVLYWNTGQLINFDFSRFGLIK